MRSHYVISFFSFHFFIFALPLPTLTPTCIKENVLMTDLSLSFSHLFSNLLVSFLCYSSILIDILCCQVYCP
ncbi:hypothetical protein CROQUDRAFT_375307 [Cronartium quercuum f. sp. fusiforme G11]|uniref:Uncharacterized protein n=1 Tax=Cronartium quercuum f. sp. fusiforme G11 TaxID=708437 RepID=A0A9P6T6A7_9BASI|nr:hypothetical protein CROQUDRAFT_375307 [Cronartium quercuum f. sp. fusiforme G11]